MTYTADEGYVYIHKINKSIYGKNITLGKSDSIDNYIQILEPAIDPPSPPEELPWHENTTIQIKLSFKNNLLLLQQYPEFGQYIKTNNITTYIGSNNYVYIYVNYILPEHEYLLTIFGAIITRK